jgi:hypothetical protein
MRKTADIIATNNFHGTEIALRVRISNRLPDGFNASLSPEQVRRARLALCPSPDCRCADSDLGTRGPQPFEILESSTVRMVIYFYSPTVEEICNA